MSSSSILTPEVWRAWSPPEALSPSQWAVKHRTLTRRQSSRPGRWRHEHAPYLAGIMDLVTRPGVEEITVMKAAQVGVSEAMRNVIGRFAHLDPDPVLLVLPDEATGRKIMRRRILPLLQDTPVLRGLFTGVSADVQLASVTLNNGFTLSLGWSGSPATLAADPARIVLNDEVDKFPPWSGREADPISLAYARTQTFERDRRIINVSTPTTSEGFISERFESSPVKLRYHVPCPHCGVYQVLRFSNVRWPRDIAETDPDRKAALIEQRRAAWYECESCAGCIDDEAKCAIVQRGVWAANGQEVVGGEPVGDWPAGSRVGVHVWAAYATWVKWHQVAAEFIRSKDDPRSLQNFKNNWLGEPFAERVTNHTTAVFTNKRDAALPGTAARMVPRWAGVLIVTADTQKDHFYFVVRAWGHKYRSRLVHHGVVRTFDELRELLDAGYELEDGGGTSGGFGGGMVRARYLLIDSGGHRTDEVYHFALTSPDRILPCKGASYKQHTPVRVSRVTYRPPDGASSVRVMLHLIDTGHFKDMLARLIATPEGEPGEWLLNAAADGEYCRQMSSEHKVAVRKGRHQVYEWRPVSSGAANHYFDCETLQCAGAEMANVGLIPDEDTLIARRERSTQQTRRPAPRQSWVYAYKGRH